ncbi:MAG: hypothetical protein ACK486_10535, partial [Cyanobacteriota bacterium]
MSSLPAAFHRFTCIEELEMLVRATGADVELMQLEMGSCRGDLLLLDLKPLELMRIRGNRSVLTIGPKDP